MSIDVAEKKAESMTLEGDLEDSRSKEMAESRQGGRRMKFEELEKLIVKVELYLLEMTQLTRPTDNVPNGGTIYVYAYASGDQRRRKHNPPRFHIFLDSGMALSIAVDITTLKPIGLYSHKRSPKCRLVKRLDSWTGYGEYERFVMAWLPLLPAKSLYSNHRRVIEAWNDNNVNQTQVDGRTFEISKQCGQIKRNGE